jgi:hypothetical protein
VLGHQPDVGEPRLELGRLGGSRLPTALG